MDLHLYNVLKNASETGNRVKEYTGAHQDSLAGTGTNKIYYWAKGLNNYVYFANLCWRIVRTTDTGGVKLVYMGVPSVANSCTSTSNVPVSTYNNLANSSIAYFGYMYNTNYIYETRTVNGYGAFANSVTYSDNHYSLINTSTSRDSTHHYQCANSECTKILYYAGKSGAFVKATILDGGLTIETALINMLSRNDVNETDSDIKTAVENWYRDNMTSYTNCLEDVIFCNNRSILDLGAWNPNGGDYNEYITFGDANSTSLSCPNETDRFSISNPKARLQYPVGLLRQAEMNLVDSDADRESMFSVSDSYSMTPATYQFDYLIYLLGYQNGWMQPGTDERKFNPVVSLKPNIMFTDGNGSQGQPYIIDTTCN